MEYSASRILGLCGFSGINYHVRVADRIWNSEEDVDHNKTGCSEFERRRDQGLTLSKSVAFNATGHPLAHHHEWDPLLKHKSGDFHCIL